MKRKSGLYSLYNSAAVLLLIVVIAATSGFSYTIHFCHGSRTGIAMYPELTNTKAGCGCEKDGMSVSSTFSYGIQPVSIHKSGCCKNLHFFQKINTVSREQIRADILPLFNLLAFCGAELIISNPERIKDNQSLLHLPPLISGKTLVFFLNQLRIPSNQGDC